MVLSTFTKSLLGGTLLAAGTGLSIGKAIFFPTDLDSQSLVKTSNKSVDVNQSEESKEESKDTGSPSPTSQSEEETRSQGTSTGSNFAASTITQPQTQPKKTCTIYKVLSFVNKTAFLAEDGFLDKEAKNQSKYKEIKDACDKADGKNIYVSRENVGWRLWPKYEWIYDKAKQGINWKIVNPK
ncbi:hypothetical protein MHC_02500 [Mycoplasma haemocanis str. Illinois]|uniref:Uncharacterized protein n=1 Tax=Mycoplasma haemocanis (strain Illinois) TaxID=1111676 RepID=H6N6U2_MYCHN|nr:hypothetical protein [Mycoplasma haemocanis]AEW45364.1 hypothetical protein MHC_02500 [Mycoplasma haemocanis str. Illinois]